MVNSNQFKKLLYEYEVLSAKYYIRDYYLNKIAQEIYENVGQVLTLIRIQLNLLSSDKNSAQINSTEPGKLIIKVIEDLRKMCRNFNPEKELLSKLGLIQTIEFDLKLLDTGKVNNLIKVTGEPCMLSPGTEVIVFRMLQEMLFCIRKEYSARPIEIKIIYEEKEVNFVIEYKGKPIEWKQAGIRADSGILIPGLDLPERAELFGGKLKIDYNKARKTCIKLVVPFKTSVYE